MLSGEEVQLAGGRKERLADVEALEQRCGQGELDWVLMKRSVGVEMELGDVRCRRERKREHARFVSVRMPSTTLRVMLTG